MKIASLADVKANFSAYVDEAIAGNPIIVTRNGKTAVVILAPTDDDDLEQLILYRSPKFQAMLDRSRQSIAAGGGIPHDEFWAQIEADAPSSQTVVAEGKTRYKASKRTSKKST